MKRFLFLSLLIFAAFATPLYSQVDEATDKGYFTNGAKDNWFVSAGGGINIYGGTEDLTYFSQNNISPAVDLAFGKWIVPSLGFRFQLTGLQAYGWSTVVSPYSLATISGGLFQELFFYTGAHFDLLWNVLDMGDNYRISRIFRLIPYIGAGAIATFNSSFEQVPVGVACSGGLILNFRLSNLISLNAELRAIVGDGRMDRVATTPQVEFMGSATVGIQFEINPKKFVRRYEMQSYYRYEIESLKKSLNLLQKENQSLKEKNSEADERYLKLLKEYN